MAGRGAERAIVAALGLLSLLSCLAPAAILATLAVKGFPALSWEFLTGESRDFGAAGGVAYQIQGTLILMCGAVVVGLPAALGAALFQTEFLSSPRLKAVFRVMTYSLNGVPTILFGLIGYRVFGVLLSTGVSWVTGVLILAVMILPTMHASILEAIEALPPHYREAGMALGLTPWQRIRSIVIPQSGFGIVTGALLGSVRAGGETAAIMFTATAFSGAAFPRSWTDPVATLQTHILVLAQEALNPMAVANAWGAALVLVGIAFAATAASLALRTRMSWESER
jgi:phosphate transport system permease protein